MARRYYTRKSNVPLKKGETVGFATGRGYFAKPKPASVKKTTAQKKAATVKRAPAKKKKAAAPRKRKPVAPVSVHLPTSLAPNKKAGKKRPVARLVSKIRLAKAKARHGLIPTRAAKRQLVVAFFKWGIAHQPLIHYAQTRPIPQCIRGKLPKLPLTTDCSGFVTMAYQYAGLPDPNGLKFNGQGYTGTLLSHGKATSKPKPGDIGIFGGSPGHHAVGAIGWGSDPDCESHGQEAGPILIRASVEQTYQPRPLTWLDLEALA